MITGVFQAVNIFNVNIQFKTVDIMLTGKTCERNSKSHYIIYGKSLWDTFFFWKYFLVFASCIKESDYRLFHT